MTQNIILRLKNLFIPSESNNFRPKFLESRYLTYYLILLLVLKLFTFPLLACFPKTSFFADVSKSVLMVLTNKDRETRGLNPLQENSQLSQAAYLKAKDMIEKDYFSHQSPEGVTPWYWIKETGYNYKFAGENLAIGFLDSEEVFNAWMLSLPHQKNVLNPNYKEMGIAVLKGDFQGSETTVVVQLFGSSLSKETPIIPEAQAKTEEPGSIATSVASAQEQKIEEKEQIEQITGEVKEKEEFLSFQTNGEKDKLSFKIFSFLNFHYYDFLQQIIYGSLFLIIIALLLNIFVKYDVQCPDLILKTFCFVLLLIFFLMLDKGAILEIIPHSFSIY